MSASIERVRDAGGFAARMAEEVRAGLQTRPLPELPSKYFYDDRGSALFDDITRLPEYYQTRTEEAILEQSCRRGRGASCNPRRALSSWAPEIGRKVRLILDAMVRRVAASSAACSSTSARASSSSPPRPARRQTTPISRCAGIVGDFLEDLPALGPGRGAPGAVPRRDAGEPSPRSGAGVSCGLWRGSSRPATRFSWDSTW